MELTETIPTGSWTLYFHSPAEKKWSIDTFKNIATVSTWSDYLSLINAFDESKWSRGMFFWMRSTIPPLWENHQNIKGGSYSLCVGATDSIDIFHRYTIGCMLGSATSKEDAIQGITISPKKGFNIIKIWNTDSTKYKTPTDMNIYIENLKLEDVIYTPFLEKKM